MRKYFREIKEVREDKKEKSLPVFPEEIGLDGWLNSLPDQIDFGDESNWVNDLPDEI